MTLHPTWPKPGRWPLQPGTVDPNQRWLWHSRPRFVLPIWEHVSADAAQRYRLLGSGITTRDWILQTGAAPAQSRYGPNIDIPTTNGAEIITSSATLGEEIRFRSNEPYTIALLLRQGATGGTQQLWRGRVPTTGLLENHIFFISTATPNFRHGGSGSQTIAGTPVAQGNWYTIVTTWRPGLMSLYQNGRLDNSSSAAATATSSSFILRRFGWEFSTSQDWNGRFALIIACASCWTDHMVARWSADPFGFPRPQHHVFTVGSAPGGGPGKGSIVMAIAC
jgi:Concanavalin A-like lectin/glucanases superfamily